MSEGCQSLYNPFSILQLFKEQRLANFWFESGTPTFLVKLIKERNYDIEQLRQLKLRELAFSTYEIETLAIVPLLFQTGYLTIKGYDPVAYFTQGKAVAGKKEFEYKWQDAKWRFANKDHLNLFTSNPEKYAPQYGGY